MLDEATEKWGVRVTRVELKSIDPPRTIQEAMEQQMRADRAKRAAVLQAEGEKQAAILRAEGMRQAAILNAEADQQANVLRAEGEKQARALRAEGEAQALGKIFDTVREAGIAPSDMLGYKYIETLPEVAAGDANKLLLLPTGAADAMGAVAGLGAALQRGRARRRSTEPPRARLRRRPRRRELLAGAGRAGRYRLVEWAASRERAHAPTAPACPGRVHGGGVARPPGGARAGRHGHLRAARRGRPRTRWTTSTARCSA